MASAKQTRKRTTVKRNHRRTVRRKKKWHRQDLKSVMN